LGTNDPLATKDLRYVQDMDDFITLAKQDDYTVVEHFVELLASGLLKKIFTSKRERERTTDKNTTLYSDHRVRAVSRILSTLIAVGVLIAPIAVLHRVDSLDTRVWGLVGFTCLFACALLFTRAKKHEVFEATAAFCAVLAVFVGTGASGSKQQL